MNPVIWDLERERRDEQRKHAEQVRLLAAAPFPGSTAPLAWRRNLGALLIRAGQRLTGAPLAESSVVRPGAGARMKPLSR
jgi:hypothetical protein